MTKTPRGLGRGVEAIFSGSTNVDDLRKPVGYINKEIAGSRPSQDTSDILRIPVDQIEPNPYQPRKNFDQEALEELSASIKALGLIQPITVRRDGTGKYQIISGERRFRACQLAGMNMIPAYIRDTNDRGMLEMAIVENIQREELDPIEVAMSYQRLIDECSLTQEEMAARLGKKRATVANQLRLLKLPAKIQHDLKVGILSVGHAKVILGVEDPQVQQQLCDLVVSDGISVRELEDRVRKIQEGTPEQKKPARREQQLTDDCRSLASRMGRYFTGAVNLRRGADGKGTMTVKFNSDEEIAGFLKALEKAEL